MALSIRFYTPAATGTLRANGRSYAISSATTDVAYNDGIAIQNDQAARLMVVGATSDRPVNVPGQINWPPREMYDTSLGKPIFLVPGSSPASWVDITGAAV
jgi:hypothetical protein